jgi:hypothetical protein
MDVLAVFRMCMPESYTREVCIPATNMHIVGERLTLPEFYRWLGCHFFMACFVGFRSNENWWSQKPIDHFDGAPFRLNVLLFVWRIFGQQSGGHINNSLSCALLLR